MTKGQVTNFNELKGFGFIKSDGNDGCDYFFHISEWQSHENTPIKGDLVEFIPGTGRDGRLRAERVSLL